MQTAKGTGGFRPLRLVLANAQLHLSPHGSQSTETRDYGGQTFLPPFLPDGRSARLPKVGPRKFPVLWDEKTSHDEPTQRS